MKPLARVALLGLWGAAACGGADPCEGRAGSCLSLEIEGALGAVDAVRLDVSGAVVAGEALAIPAGVHALPVILAVLLPDAGGHFALSGVATLGGKTVGLGKTMVDVAPRARAHVQLLLLAVDGASCSDGYRDGDETDRDCGGPTCGPCALGRACAGDADCANAFCDAKICRAPSCGDGRKDGGESDVDCGGPCVTKCAEGLACLAGSDCASAVCSANRCAAATCSDGTKNGGETDVDCGGPCPSHCGDGRACLAATDCANGVCAIGRCAAPTCSDGVKNGSEGDVDCGGSSAGAGQASCARCADGKTCNAGSDCASGVCKMGRCATATCSDGVRNGGETDVDCGGGCVVSGMGRCGDGRACLVAGDCASGICAGKLCTPAGCSDGIQNGGETDVDCGGPCPSKCGDGKGCAGATDCQSSVCNAAKCAAPTCSDGTKNGKETDVDCGGGSCSPCKAGRTCLVATDCAGGQCALLRCGLAFAPAVSVAVGGKPTQVALADLNGDSHPDLVLADKVAGSASVLLGQGGVAFKPPVTYVAGSSPSSLALADFNLDKVTDLAVANLPDDALRFFFGAGDGSFRLPSAVCPSTQGLCADMPTMMPPLFGPIALVAGDFDGDLKPDLAAALKLTSTARVWTNSGGKLLFASDGTVGNGPELLVAGDFNGDGKLDLASANNGTVGGYSVLLGFGTGQFQTAMTTTLPGSIHGLAAADLNRDGQTDLLLALASPTAQDDHSVAVLLAGAQGKLRAPVTVTVGTRPAGMVVADFDRDGNPDLAVAANNDNAVTVLRGAGDGSFPVAVAYAVGTGPVVLVAADLNADGRPDLVVINSDSGDVSVLLNTNP